MKNKAYAKVNLLLKVIGKREDGYHLLQMVNAKINLADIISINKIKGKDIIVNFYGIEEPQNNIVKKVAIYMQERFFLTQGMRIKIKKKIPIGAGLGGGSADVASVIHIIDKLFELNLNLEEKRKIGILFGADIPYCLTDKMAIVEGIGEKVTPIDLNLPYKILIVNPKIELLTKEVFKKVKCFSKKINNDELIFRLENGQALDIMENDLQPLVLNDYPIIKELKDTISAFSTKKIMMSGSGATIFMLIDKENACKIKKEIIKRYPNFYVSLHRFIKKG